MKVLAVFECATVYSLYLLWDNKLDNLLIICKSPVNVLHIFAKHTNTIVDSGFIEWSPFCKISTLRTIIIFKNLAFWHLYYGL